jgi:hypothetical protein
VRDSTRNSHDVFVEVLNVRYNMALVSSLCDNSLERSGHKIPRESWIGLSSLDASSELDVILIIRGVDARALFFRS